MTKSERKKLGIGGIGPLEADVLKLVWENKKVTVRDIYEIMGKERKIAYTTVMTIMGNLARKGLLKQNKSRVAYVYTPVYKNTEVATSIVDKVIDKLLSGDKKSLLFHLLGLKKQEDLEKILKFKRKL